jgi:lysophospholipase L1-like esterase
MIAAITRLHAADASLMTIPVDSPAFVFSPGNWTGDVGRAGKVFRQTWNPGAYFRVTWESKSPLPVAKLQLDISTHQPSFKPPLLAYSIDGIWKSRTPCARKISIGGLTGAGHHELAVYLQGSEQQERWGSTGKSGLNVLRVTGLLVDATSTPIPATPGSKWALIIGDSITEGNGVSELAGYSHLVGQALRGLRYEYAISACGYSGWINRGDGPPGDVPGYYAIRNSRNGNGGQYEDAASRWNKIDGNNHSLLDSKGHLSAYGQTSQEPSLIMINYGTNDILYKSNPSDTAASITQCLAALRASAPNSQIIILIPFGQYYAKELKDAVDARRKARPADARIAIIDLGPEVANNLEASNGLMGGLHPNDRGHANFAATIIPKIMKFIGN